jgi:hypothetical protein
MSLADFDFAELSRTQTEINALLAERSKQDKDIEDIKNPKTPERTLQHIAKTGTRKALSAFKVRKELPPKVTHILFHERMKDLGAILSHPALPMNIVRKALTEGDKHQIPYALRHPGITSDDVEKVFIRMDKQGDLLNVWDGTLSEAIVKHKNLRPEFVHAYVKKNLSSLSPGAAFLLLAAQNLLIDTLRLFMSMNAAQVSLKILERDNLDIAFLVEVAENGNTVAREKMAKERRAEVIQYACDKWDLNPNDFPEIWFGSVAGWKWM